MPQQTHQAGMTDMTTGSPLRLLVRFSIPLLLGNVFQQLYNMVDSIVVGRFVGQTALAAVGVGFPVLFMMSSLFNGIGVGASVMIAQFYGAREEGNVRDTVNTLYATMMVGILPLTLLSLLLCDPILMLMRVPPDTMADARAYMLIVFAGLIGSLGFNINTGILQGLGDSRTPLLFLTIACGINIALDLLFVLSFGMGVAGVALATVIAQACSWLFGIFYINRKYSILRIRLLRFQFHRELFIKAMRLGIPTGIQQMLFGIGTLAVQSLVNSYGSAFMAGYNGANKLDTFAFMPIQSFASAITTFTGQNIGAGKLERVREGIKSTLLLSFSICIVVGGGVLIFDEQLMRMFSTSPEVIAGGVAFLRRILPFYCMLALFFILNGAMRGAGEMLVPMFASILSLWAARVPAAYLFAHFFGRDNLFFCYAAGWLIGDVFALYFYLKGNWKQKAVASRPSETQPAP